MIDHVISKIKFNRMEYTSVSGEKKSVPASAFCLGIIPHGRAGKAGDDRIIGLNIGIAIPFATFEESTAWFNDFCKNEWGFFGVVVSSEDGFRIPLVVHAGNYWSDDYGSACLFAYFSPGYFEGRPEPRKVK